MIAAADTQDRVKARLIRNIRHDFPRAMQLHAAPVICSIRNPAEEMQPGQMQSAATASPASFSGISPEQAAAVREGMNPEDSPQRFPRLYRRVLHPCFRE